MTAGAGQSRKPKPARRSSGVLFRTRAGAVELLLAPMWGGVYREKPYRRVYARSRTKNWRFDGEKIPGSFARRPRVIERRPARSSRERRSRDPNQEVSSTTCLTRRHWVRTLPRADASFREKEEGGAREKDISSKNNPWSISLTVFLLNDGCLLGDARSRAKDGAEISPSRNRRLVIGVNARKPSVRSRYGHAPSWRAKKSATRLARVRKKPRRCVHGACGFSLDVAPPRPVIEVRKILQAQNVEKL